MSGTSSPGKHQDSGAPMSPRRAGSPVAANRYPSFLQRIQWRSPTPARGSPVPALPEALGAEEPAPTRLGALRNYRKEKKKHQKGRRPQTEPQARLIPLLQLLCRVPLRQRGLGLAWHQSSSRGDGNRFGRRRSGPGGTEGRAGPRAQARAKQRTTKRARGDESRPLSCSRGGAVVDDEPSPA